MIKNNRPHRSVYDLAQKRIRNGDWRVDPERGLLFGVQGRPFANKRQGPHGGYIVCTPDNQHTILVHRIIWEYVNGPITEGLVINHLNGVKDDNRIANLEMVTFRENNVHAYETGLMVNKQRAATECPIHGVEFGKIHQRSDGNRRFLCRECNRLRMARKRANA